MIRCWGHVHQAEVFTLWEVMLCNPRRSLFISVEVSVLKKREKRLRTHYFVLSWLAYAQESEEAKFYSALVIEDEEENVYVTVKHSWFMAGTKMNKLCALMTILYSQELHWGQIFNLCKVPWIQFWWWRDIRFEIDEDWAYLMKIY